MTIHTNVHVSVCTYTVCYTMYVVCLIPRLSFLYVYALGPLNRFKGQCAITGGYAGGEPNMQSYYSCSQTLLMCVKGLKMT